MSVSSLGGKLSTITADLVYSSPMITISSMGQVVEATSVNYTDTGSAELLALSKTLLTNLETLQTNTQEAIQDKNTFKENYETQLALEQVVEEQYNTLLERYNTIAAEYAPTTKYTIVKTIGYVNSTLNEGIDLLNSSIGQFGDTSQGYCNPVSLGTQTLEAGSYAVYVNLSASGVGGGTSVAGQRLNQNTLVFSVVDSNYLVIGGTNINSSNFCEYNVSTDENLQGVLVSISGVATFTLTASTLVSYDVMIMRDENYNFNTPNFIASNTYTRPAYATNNGNQTNSISLNQRGIVVVRMN
jgi:hypothetical protein